MSNNKQIQHRRKKSAPTALFLHTQIESHVTIEEKKQYQRKKRTTNNLLFEMIALLPCHFVSNLYLHPCNNDDATAITITTAAAAATAAAIIIVAAAGAQTSCEVSSLSPARRQISTSQASDFRSIVSVKHLAVVAVRYGSI
jgi:hypothetical protein